MSLLAIIPARGGSKRIPRKNLRSFLGKPIIAYSIEAARDSLLFDEVMVSTDDSEIAEVASRYGASVPFMRSDSASDDYATTAQVLEEVVADYKASGRAMDYACCLYPTAPFVSGEKLQSAYRKLIETDADTVLPITRFGFPIWRSFRREGERVFYNWPEFAPRRSQDLSAAYQDAGQFYFFKPDVLERTRLLITDNTVGIEVSALEVQDIDSEEDWVLAELKYTHAQQKRMATGQLPRPLADGEG